MTAINYRKRNAPLHPLYKLDNGQAFIHSTFSTNKEVLFMKSSDTIDDYIRCTRLENGEITILNPDSLVEPCDIEVNVIRRTAEPM